ncbi:hypothetical protein [Proteus phage vB_PmiP_RS8pmA]|uniref:Uncharacterized protein n=1 Tax=Proteus phage vB_PmiP_RS8pmA TaxID=2250314 RepID=A0A514CY72_9CAUD|nr:hypothetical protein [Proteus phage vB_PmiP_RS8pmA]
MSNTQSNLSNNTKTVLYYGKEFEVPVGQVYIHTDSRGAVYTSILECNRSPVAWLFVKGSRGARVGSFNHTEMSRINWELSQKRISDLPSVSSGLVPEQKAHPHADLMLKYAQIAQYSDKPWEEFQYKSVCDTWNNCTHLTRFNPERQYRLKPQPTRIKEGQLWISTKEAVLVEVHSVKHPELQKGSIVVAQRINPECTLYSELTITELQEHFTLVK